MTTLWNVTINQMWVDRKTHKVTDVFPLDTYLSSSPTGNGALVRAYIERPPHSRETDKYDVVYTIGQVQVSPMTA